MISILIPIYNNSVVQLVQELVTQCFNAKIAFEIICLDDLSSPKYHEINRAISPLIGVNYVELTDKYGRSKIRNKLAALARFDHLLFLDSDSKVISKRYIKKYLNAIQTHPNEILVGGRSYAKKEPKNPAYRLHWLYGSKRESPPAKLRNKRSAELFHSNNFLTPREILETIPFDESIKGYGYEDIQWAHKVEKSHNILHLDNPIKHAGLKKCNLFLKEIEESISNLVLLYKENPHIQTKLIRSYELLFKLGISTLFIKLLNYLKGQIISRLNSPNPKLIYLDLIKLHYFATCLSIERK